MPLEIEKYKKRKSRPAIRVLPTSNSILKVEGITLQHLFEKSLWDLAYLISPGSCSLATHYDCVMKVEVSADNTTNLLINFLTEVLSLTYTQQAIFCTMYAEEITEKKLEAQIFGTWFKNYAAKIKSISNSKCIVNRKEDSSYSGSIVFEL